MEETEPAIRRKFWSASYHNHGYHLNMLGWKEPASAACLVSKCSHTGSVAFHQRRFIRRSASSHFIFLAVRKSTSSSRHGMAPGSTVPGLGLDLEHPVCMDHVEDHEGISGKYRGRRNSERSDGEESWRPLLRLWIFSPSVMGGCGQDSSGGGWLWLLCLHIAHGGVRGK